MCVCDTIIIVGDLSPDTSYSIEVTTIDGVNPNNTSVTIKKESKTLKQTMYLTNEVPTYNSVVINATNYLNDVVYKYNNKNSTTPFLASVTFSLVIFLTTMPSITFVLQLATNFGIGLGSAVEPAATSTKHVRHLPPLPSNLL